MSHECNQFIIKDGVFLRDFEAMYQKVEDPWDQSKNHDDDLVNNGAFGFLKSLYKQGHKHPQRILDLGCADGYYAHPLLDASLNASAVYVGTDISETVIRKASQNVSSLSGVKDNTQFLVDDIRVLNQGLTDQFDLIFSAKTLYYVAPEIDQVLDNVMQYLKREGLLCFTYNQTPEAFTNQWLTYTLLRKKLLKLGCKEKLFVEINRQQAETFAIGVFEKT